MKNKNRRNGHSRAKAKCRHYGSIATSNKPHKAVATVQEELKTMVTVIPPEEPKDTTFKGLTIFKYYPSALAIITMLVAFCTLGVGEALIHGHNGGGMSDDEKVTEMRGVSNGVGSEAFVQVGEDDGDKYQVDVGLRSLNGMLEIENGVEEFAEGGEIRRTLLKRSRNSILGAVAKNAQGFSRHILEDSVTDTAWKTGPLHRREFEGDVDKVTDVEGGVFQVDLDSTPLVHGPVENAKATSNYILQDKTFASDLKNPSPSFKKHVTEFKKLHLEHKAIPNDAVSKSDDQVIDDGVANDKTADQDIDVVTSEIGDILNNIQLISFDGISSGSDEDMLKLSASVISQVKDRISDSQLILSMPANFQPMFRTLLNELTSAERHIKTIEDLVSEHHCDQKTKPDTNATKNRGRILSSERDASTKYYYNSGVSKADYHIRSKSHHLHKHRGLGEIDHQQGYHRARASRQAAGTRRRLSQDDGSVCVDVDPNDRKEEQCLRLANCARNYNIYDLFVFLFGDDINFDTGTVDKKEKIKAEDESELLEKLSRIKVLSGQVLLNYMDGQLQPESLILRPGNKCDQLLQEFHRFDEDLSVKGKWQGGSVTGVCRGWGTNKFMTLESIYYISDSVLSIEERVEDCIQSIVQDFNNELQVNFTLLENPCIGEFGGDADFGGLETTRIVQDIRKKFQCLYYSVLTRTLGENCADYDGCNPFACVGMFLRPVFVAKERFDLSFLWFRPERTRPSFEYELPVVLPSRKDRISGILSTSYYGRFLLDGAAINDLTSESFIIEVFDEYMGCAADLVKNLTDGGDRRSIFSENSVYNPYAPDSTNPNQFQLPLTIKDDATDEHGQLRVEHLDEIFRYILVGAVNDGQELVETEDTPKFSENLKTFLATAYNIDELIDELIEIFKECEDDDRQWVANYCEARLSTMEFYRNRFFNRGLDRSSLDTSIALIFGNKTTIGQVCSFANGLRDGTVDDVPGFCCLDAPYESLPDWGEKFSCEKYVSLADGSTKVVQKSTTDCQRLGPVTSGFNEAACDIFHGTWCPTPRSCSSLVKCVKDAKEEVLESRDRQAFFEYLDEAPEVKDHDDPTKCGDLREYFDYDRDYPDDDRICEEVLDLQCFTDFSNLDGFATGTAGPDGGMEELAVSEKVKLISKMPFDCSAAKAWRTANFVISKVIEVIEFVLEQLDAAGDLCTIAISFAPGTSAPCTVPVSVSKIVTASILFALKLAIDISERIYSEIVDAQDADYEDDRQQSTYENVITNHGNIITTFYATQQLKVMLGEISEGLAKDDEEEDRRRLSDCVSTAEGFVLGCDKESCEDPTRLCDGSFNFPHIAIQKGAGCDTLDSDGDGQYDVCEDRFAPELVVRDAARFRCDQDNDSRLCHDGNVFRNEKEVKHFLKYQFPATDDCASTDKLEVNIEYERGSCRDTIYKLTPLQDISACDDWDNPSNITYENPLRGNSKEVAVQLDDEAPAIQCGFRSDDTSINIVDEKTLYHYMLDFDGDGLRLDDARFFYEVYDNCEDDIRINVVVKSNEIQQNQIAELFTFNMAGSVEKAQIFYAGTSCETMGEDLICKKDPSMQKLNVRFYEITAIAIDTAGNSASDTCKVIVVPRCSPSLFDECKRYNAGENLNVEGFYYPLNIIEEEIAQSQVLHNIAEAELLWEQGLEIYHPEPSQHECENRCPPSLVVHDAGLFQCDEDDTSKLCYDGDVFKSEKQVKNFLQYQFTATDDCSSTNKLDVKIEHAAGSCHDTVYSLTPVHVCGGTEPVEIGHSSMLHSYESPQHGTSKNVTVHLDDKAPVIQCGFRLDDSSINIVEGKTLYHYMLDSGRDGLDGLRLDDARLFYNVTENCEDSLRIDIVVESNEIQQNQIAKLFKYNMAGSVQQAKFLYSGTSCENMGEDLFCEQDPTMHNLKVRFYNIALTAYDSAGNTGSDTCEVVIVPKCYPSLFGQCEKYETSSSKSSSDISSRKLNHKDNYYYTREIVAAAVAKSEVLYRVVEAELVWEHGLNYPQKDILQPRKGKSAKGAKSETQDTHTQTKRTKKWEMEANAQNRGHTGKKGPKGAK